jgi:hypothetical protein
MAHRSDDHFEERAAHLCRFLNIDQKGNQYLLAVASKSLRLVLSDGMPLRGSPPPSFFFLAAGNANRYFFNRLRHCANNK